MFNSGSLQQRLRLWSGLILFFYATLHFINHSLGHISVEAMNAMLNVVSAFWRSWPGTILLYGSLIVHASLGLFKLANIRTLRRPVWEWVQVLIGVAIPIWLSTHIIFTRGAETRFGIEVDYPLELALLWPARGVQQNLLLLLVWTHGLIGLHYWLRIREWYASALPYLIGLAVFVPALAITGWIAAARRQAIALTPSETSSAVASEQAEIAAYLQQESAVAAQLALWLAGGALVLVAAVVVVRFLTNRMRKQYQVSYSDGRIVNASPGQTLLDVSRAAGIPHMAVCGGRARCSTCRTLVVSSPDSLTPHTEAELSLLSKINADTNIRLACQARVRDNLEVRPLIQPEVRSVVPRNADPLGWGVERELAILFLDIRGFSKLSEGSLPYDIIFILNSFFGEITTAIETSNGYIDKYMGDGVMAIFGLEGSYPNACRDAIAASAKCVEAANRSSRLLTQHLKQPLKIGVGVHAGQAIIGRIGRASGQTSPSRLTAIGETVNIAARLESATKELACPIVVSTELAESAGLKVQELPGERSRIKVHNISALIDVVAVSDEKKLQEALGQLEAVA